MNFGPPDGDRCWIALSDSELLVLRYLPINLSAAEIAREPHVSPHSVRTFNHNLYAKFRHARKGRRVESARPLGLLALG